MDPIFRRWFYAGAAAAVVLGLWLAHLWSAEHQVQRHSEHFLRQVEKRNWRAIGDFVAPDYHDDWGDDRTRLLERLRLTLRLFSSLTITTPNPPDVQIAADSAIWKAKIQIAGRGPEITPGMIERVNRLTAPFELRWRKESWRPWDWRLVQVRNPELKLPADFW